MYRQVAQCSMACYLLYIKSHIVYILRRSSSHLRSVNAFALIVYYCGKMVRAVLIKSFDINRTLLRGKSIRVINPEAFQLQTLIPSQT